MTYLRPRGSHVSCSSYAGKLELSEITLLWEGGKHATTSPKTARTNPILGFKGPYEPDPVKVPNVTRDDGVSYSTANLCAHGPPLKLAVKSRLRPDFYCRVYIFILIISTYVSATRRFLLQILTQKHILDV